MWWIIFYINKKEYYQQGSGSSSSSESSGNNKELLPPHAFSIADNACRSMKNKLNDIPSPSSISSSENKTSVCADQSALASGESGAGKNASTKHVMKHLATLSHFDLSLDDDDHCGCKVSSSTQNKNQVEQQGKIK